MDERETREFLQRQQMYAQRMREMNARAARDTHQMPPAPPFVSIPSQRAEQTRNFSAPEDTHTENPAPTASKDAPASGGINAMLGSLKLPTLSQIKNDPDVSLILGLLLLLYSEKADKLLIYALLYILL